MAELPDTAYEVIEGFDGSETLEDITYDTLDFSAREIGVGVAKLVRELVSDATDPIARMFGAPTFASFDFNSSSLAGLTALSQTPDVENANTSVPGAYYVQNNTATDAWCGRYLTPPAPPFTVITCVKDSDVRVNVNSAGVFIGEATPGVLELMTWTRNDANIRGAIAYRFTNPTTFAAELAVGQLNIEPPFWLALRVNSATSVDYLYSYAGSVWIRLVSARNPSITIGSCGIAMNAESASGSASAFEFLRVWNTALTFPGAST